MKKGDIVIVEFPFTDLISTKLRPAVILAENRFDLVICFITSNIRIKETGDLILTPARINGLKTESLIKVNKIMTVDKGLVKGKIGQLSSPEIGMLNSGLLRLFHIK